MIHLAIDTSGDSCLLLLFRESSVLSLRFFSHKNNLSASLVPSLSDLFRDTGYRLQDVSSIFAGTGPGSYTGVRIGLAVATSSALGLDVPLRPFCSLIPFIPDTLEEGPFLFLFDCGHPSVFLLEGRAAKGGSVLFDREGIVDLQAVQPDPEATLICFNPEKIKKELLFLSRKLRLRTR